MSKKIVVGILILVLGGVGLVLWNYEDPKNAHAGNCFLTGESTSGMNKICYYDCAGGEVAITIRSHQYCPYSINR